MTTMVSTAGPDLEQTGTGQRSPVRIEKDEQQRYSPHRATPENLREPASL